MPTIGRWNGSMHTCPMMRVSIAADTSKDVKVSSGMPGYSLILEFTLATLFLRATALRLRKRTWRWETSWFALDTTSCSSIHGWTRTRPNTGQSSWEDPREALGTKSLGLITPVRTLAATSPARQQSPARPNKTRTYPYSDSKNGYIIYLPQQRRQFSIKDSRAVQRFCGRLQYLSNTLSPSISYIKSMKAIILVAFLAFTAYACVNRDQAVSRAMEWVNARVPYDKNRNYNGYVMGCEGIVGYGWQFPKPGVPSWDLIPKGYCKQISKAELANGDLLVCPNEHQLIFNGWANADKSSYYGIEESGSVGSTRRSIPWPYFSGYNPGCYVPCRVTSACVSDESSLQNLQTQ